jgi:Na+-driven multidrug efflux pump
MLLGIDIPLAKRIVSLAIPVILAMLAQTAINLLDTAMVGRLPGATGIDGVAGIGLSMPLFWAVGGFLSAVAYGTQAITARRFGEGDSLLAGRALTNSLLVAGFSSVVVSMLGYLFSPDLFALFFNSNENVARLGSSYCAIRMLGVFSMVMTFSYKAFFDGIGKTYVHMVASIVMNLLNFGLNIVLIFGLFGFPRMEVDGAAYASLISTYVGLAIMLFWSFKPGFLRKYRYYRLRNSNRRVIWEICRLSVPSGLANIFVMSGFLFFQWVVGNLDKGPQVLSALSFVPLAGPAVTGVEVLQPDLATSASWIMVSFLMLIFMTSMALGTATATLVSQSLGSKQPTLAERYGWESVKIGMLVMGTLGIAVMIWPGMFLGIFTDKTEVIALAVPTMRLMGSVSSLIAAGLILVQALFGAGNTKFVMMAELIMHLLCLVPLSYLLGVVFKMGMIGTWTAAVVYILLLSTVMAWKFFEGKWKNIRI